jgi:hypothetical protein
MESAPTDAHGQPLSWQIHGNSAQKISAVCSAVALLLAILGFIFAYWQLSALRESSAKRQFGEYLRLAAEKPELSDPDYAVIKGNIVSLAGYKSFVWTLLYGCEEIMSNFGSDRGWERTCRDHMTRHVRYLCEFEVKQLDAYSGEMQNFIRSIVNETKKRQDLPECNSP